MAEMNERPVARAQIFQVETLRRRDLVMVLAERSFCYRGGTDNLTPMPFDQHCPARLLIVSRKDVDIGKDVSLFRRANPQPCRVDGRLHVYGQKPVLVVAIAQMNADIRAAITA